MAKIAFLGLGQMGRAMADRLLTAGHRVGVFNRTASRATSLAERGARVYLTPREACEGVDVVMSMVADDVASRHVWLGRDGALAAGLPQHAVAIECSTLSHAWVMELAAQCRSLGLRYVDCPVTGLPDAAASGALTLLVGAKAEDLEAVRSILNELSDKLIHFGPVGAGTAYKLIVNMIGAVQIASMAEGLALAQRAGLTLSTVVDAIASSQAASAQVVRNSRRMLAADHDQDVVFTAALRLKDVEYATRLAGELGMTSLFGAVAEAAYRELCEGGNALVNESKIIEVFRMKGVIRS